MKTLKLLFACFMVLCLASVAMAECMEGDKLATIKARGYLKAGIRNSEIKGFIEHIGADGTAKKYDGLEPDFARAIAVAIFGTQDPDSKIEWVEVGGTTRFTALLKSEGEEGQADVTIRTVTNTSKRDMTREGVGFEFGPIYFYDGSNVLVNTQEVVGTFNVAAPQGTSNTADLIRLRDGGIPGAQWPANWNIVIVPESAPGADDAAAEAIIALRNGTYTTADGTTYNINGTVSDGGAILTPAKVAAIDDEIAGAEDWYLYFPSPFSKSPLAAITKDGDENLAEVVRWVFNVLIAAEEEGYTSTRRPPRDWGPTVPGLRDGWARDVIGKVGNYKEIWDKNLGKYGDAFEPRGINNLYINNGLLYPMPIVPDPDYICQ